MHEIIIGRNPEDFEKYGNRGTGIIARHYVGEKQEAHLTNYVRIDLARPHIIGLFGKRGTGKSYSMGTLAEEILMQPDDFKSNIAGVIIDTMGIYWSMKNANERDFQLLSDWNLKPQGFPVRVLIPEGHVAQFEEHGIKFDATFSLRPADLDSGSWGLAFNLNLDTEMGLLMGKVIKELKEEEQNYGIPEIIERISKQDAEKLSKEGLINRFTVAESWGVFNPEGSSIHDIVQAGKLSIVDISQYSLATGAWSVRSLIVGLLAKKILEERMKARRAEELETMENRSGEKAMPITWMLIDEAHQFLPAEGETAASRPLLQWVKIGREPGVSLVLATQMPNKLHQEAISQCDLVISHRLTSRADIDSLRNLMQTYLKYDIPSYFDALPKVKGGAIVLDDNSERIYEIRLRPRMSWHAGGSPIVMKD